MRKKVDFSASKLHRDIVGAAFIIFLFSVFILTKFAIDYILILYLSTISVSFLTAVFYPRSGFYAIVFLTFVFARFFALEPILIGRAEIKLYPLDIIFIGTMIGIFFQFLLGKTIWRTSKTDKWVIVFMLLSLAYLVTSLLDNRSDFNASFSTFKNYAFYSLFYFVPAFLFQKKEDWTRLSHFFLAGAATLIFFIFYGILNGEGLWTEFTPLSTQGARIISFDHAFYISLIVIGLPVYLIHSQKPSKIHTHLLIGLWLIGITGALMRHIWLGLLGTGIFLFLVFDQKKKGASIRFVSKYLFAFGMAAFLLMYLSLMAPQSDTIEKLSLGKSFISERVGSFSNFSADESFSWRQNVWQEAFIKYKESPVWGIGYGQKISIDNGDYRDFIEIRNIHNSPLILLIQMGIFATAVFAMIIFSSMYQIKQKKETLDWIDHTLLGALFYYLIVFQFQPYLEANLLGIFFWIILGLIKAKVCLEQNK